MKNNFAISQLLEKCILPRGIFLKGLLWSCFGSEWMWQEWFKFFICSKKKGILKRMFFTTPINIEI